MHDPWAFLTTRTGIAIAALALAVAAGGAEAQTAPPAGIGGGPNAEYTAEFKIQGNGPKARGRVYGAPGKERRETADSFGGSTLIMRYDLGLVWTLLPNQTYTEYALRPPGMAPLPPGSPPPGLTRIEDDDINDVKATKYAFPATPGGPGGYVWLSREGIALRIDGMPRPGEPEIRFELDNLRYGPQSAALFDPPPGYRKLEPPAPPPPAPQSQVQPNQTPPGAPRSPYYSYPPGQTPPPPGQPAPLRPPGPTNVP